MALRLSQTTKSIQEACKLKLISLHHPLVKIHFLNSIYNDDDSLSYYYSYHKHRKNIL